MRSSSNDNSDRPITPIARPLHRALTAMGAIIVIMVLASYWQTHRIVSVIMGMFNEHPELQRAAMTRHEPVLRFMSIVVPAATALLGATAWWWMRDAIKRAESVVQNRANVHDENLKQANDAACTSRHQLISNVSHNIRNSITSILGYAEELEEPDLPNNEQRHAIRTIHRHGRHLLHVLNDAVDLTKLEANELQPERRRYSPIKLLADLNSTLHVRASYKNLPYNIEYRSGIPQMIETDPIRLRQILLSVIGNAIRFTDSGQVRTVVSLDDSPGRSPQLVFDVIDTGIGVGPQDRARIFEPFAQVGMYEGEQEEGTGLGLAIGRQLAVLLGGDLTLEESEPGKGSRFRLTVHTGSLDGVDMIQPADKNAVTGANPATSLDPAKKTAGAAECPQLDGCRILVVDDGRDNQRLLEYALRKASAEVVLAEHGGIAVDVAIKAHATGRPFDIILMDMQMPVMDGYEATRELRRLGIEVPIIAVTAYALPGDRQKCLDAGCSDYHAKPIDRAVLLKTICSAVQAAPVAS